MTTPAGDHKWRAHHKNTPLIDFYLTGSLDEVALELQKRRSA